MKSFLQGLAQFFKALIEFFKQLPTIITKLPWFLNGLWRAIRRCFRRPPRGGCCLDLPPNVYVRPDPMIYDQYYLMAQGLAVTWDNPDIQLYDAGGTPVSPDDLNADQDYKVVVRVWNNSYFAPAAGLPVILSFLSFGIGITSTPVGASSTDLGVKGSTHCPAYANFTWHTPKTPGHYCLQAHLAWPDDANPNNNLGQKNTQVGKVNSPAEFTIAVHNPATVRRRFEMEMDMYRLPVLPPCSDRRAAPPEEGRHAESRARWDVALRTQGYGMYPVTPAWNVAINPNAFELGPLQTVNVVVSIEPTSGSFNGTQSFNLHGFASSSAGFRDLVGGVTLNVEGS
jgi:hypothetical protein